MILTTDEKICRLDHSEIILVVASTIQRLHRDNPAVDAYIAVNQQPESHDDSEQK